MYIHEQDGIEVGIQGIIVREVVHELIYVEAEPIPKLIRESVRLNGGYLHVEGLFYMIREDLIVQDDIDVEQLGIEYITNKNGELARVHITLYNYDNDALEVFMFFVGKKL